MTYFLSELNAATFDSHKGRPWPASPSEAQYGPTACNPASCASGKCQATGECICQQHRKIAERHVPLVASYDDEVSPEQARAINRLVSSEFKTGNWVDVEQEAPPSARTIIAFTGLAGAGKSTAAQHLVARRGFQRVRFAGPLKSMLAALGCSQEQIEGSEKEMPCELLCGKTPRQAMQWLGTEFGRNLIGPDLWIRAWQSAVANVPAGVPVVVDDCRFPNEAAAVLEAGGLLVRIERPGAGTASLHSSEQHALPAARTLHNTLSTRNLKEQVDIMLGDLSWAALS